jgi:hypothetical protein
MSLVTIEGHTLCPRFVSADSVVLDIGANIGTVSRLMAERFGMGAKPPPNARSAALRP